MSKTMLVAQREFMENMRTKTFWLGILSFPILIVFAIFGQKLLADSKDVRKYAVLDRSEGQWLSRAVSARATQADIGKLLEEVTEAKDEDERTKLVQKWWSALTEDHPLRIAERQFGLDILSMIANPPELSDQQKQQMSKWRDQLAPGQIEELAKVAGGLSLDDYRQVQFDDLGDDPEKALSEKLNDEKIFAYFVIGPDPEESDETSAYVSNNITDNELRKWYASHATEIVRDRRIKNLNLSAEDAASIRGRYEFAQQNLDGETGEVKDVEDKEKLGGLAPIAFVYLLWIAVFTAAQMLLTNTIEEKSNRLIEVLLSSVSPMQLMAGKVIGIGATGLTIVLSWVISALIGVQFMSGKIAELGLTAIISDPLYLGSFVAYFLAGYLLYAAFLVAIGSVCDSLKEAQSLMQPVFIILIVPLIAMVFVVQDPNGTVARFLTYIPLFTPFLMMNRAGGPPPTWEYVATTILIIVSLAIAFWAAAKVFRVGILMTGKPPKVSEILRWLRAPVGQVAERKQETTD